MDDQGVVRREDGDPSDADGTTDHDGTADNGDGTDHDGHDNDDGPDADTDADDGTADADDGTADDPAQDLADAEQETRDILNQILGDDAPTVDFTSSPIDPATVREFNNAIQQLAADYPDTMRQLNHIGSEDVSSTLGPGEEDTLAYATLHGDDQGIYISDEPFADNAERALDGADEEASGFTVPGGGSAEGVFTHEFGHQLGEQLLNDPQMLGDLNQAVSDAIGAPYDATQPHDPDTRQRIEDALSQYGATTPHEMLAEAFAEYRLSDNPRDLARAIGQVMDQHLRTGPDAATPNTTPDGTPSSTPDPTTPTPDGSTPANTGSTPGDGTNSTPGDTGSNGDGSNSAGPGDAGPGDAGSGNGGSDGAGSGDGGSDGGSSDGGGSHENRTAEASRDGEGAPSRSEEQPRPDQGAPRSDNGQPRTDDGGSGSQPRPGEEGPVFRRSGASGDQNVPQDGTPSENGGPAETAATPSTPSSPSDTGATARPDARNHYGWYSEGQPTPTPTAADPAASPAGRTPSEAQPRTPGEERPRTTDESQPRTTDEGQPRTPGEEQPRTTDESQPRTPGEERPRTTDEGQPSTTDEAQPRTPGEEQPRTTDEGQPPTPGEEQPRTTDDGQPRTPGEEQPRTTDESQPRTPGEEQPRTPGEDEGRPRTSDDGQPRDESTRTPSDEGEGRPRTPDEGEGRPRTPDEGEAGPRARDGEPHRDEGDPGARDRSGDDESAMPRSRGPENLPDHLRDVWHNSEETPAGRSYFHPDDLRMRDGAHRLSPPPNGYVVSGYGDPNGMVAGGRHLTPGEVADLVRNDPNWNGRPLYLLSDNTGRGDFGPRLAQELGVPVVTPNGPVRVDENGLPHSSGWTRHVPVPTPVPVAPSATPPGHGPGTPSPAHGAPVPDPRPGHVDPDGVRRFDNDADGEAYGENHLSHVYANLPPHLQNAIRWYTRQSMQNSYLRPGADLPGAMRHLADEHSRLNALAQLNNGRPVTIGDVQRMASRPDLNPQQREAVNQILGSPDPLRRLGNMGEAAGYRQFLHNYFGEPPTVDAFNRRIGELDQALAQPLPEPVQTIRGLHDVNFMRTSDGSPLGNRDPRMLIGSTQTEPGYMSTSLGTNPAVVDGNPFEFRIRLNLPPGAHGVWMGTQSEFPNQRELILPRGVQYQITNVTPTGFDRFGRPTFDIEANVILPGHNPGPGGTPGMPNPGPGGGPTPGTGPSGPPHPPASGPGGGPHPTPSGPGGPHPPTPGPGGAPHPPTSGPGGGPHLPASGPGGGPHPPTSGPGSAPHPPTSGPGGGPHPPASGSGGGPHLPASGSASHSTGHPGAAPHPGSGSPGAGSASHNPPAGSHSPAAPAAAPGHPGEGTPHASTTSPGSGGTPHRPAPGPYSPPATPPGGGPVPGNPYASPAGTGTPPHATPNGPSGAPHPGGTHLGGGSTPHDPGATPNRPGGTPHASATPPGSGGAPHGPGNPGGAPHPGASPVGGSAAHNSGAAPGRPSAAPHTGPTTPSSGGTPYGPGNPGGAPHAGATAPGSGGAPHGSPGGHHNPGSAPHRPVSGPYSSPATPAGGGPVPGNPYASPAGTGTSPHATPNGPGGATPSAFGGAPHDPGRPGGAPHSGGTYPGGGSAPHVPGAAPGRPGAAPHHPGAMPPGSEGRATAGSHNLSGAPHLPGSGPYGTPATPAGGGPVPGNPYAGPGGAGTVPHTPAGPGGTPHRPAPGPYSPPATPAGSGPVPGNPYASPAGGGRPPHATPGGPGTAPHRPVANPHSPPPPPWGNGPVPSHPNATPGGTGGTPGRPPATPFGPGTTPGAPPHRPPSGAGNVPHTPGVPPNRPASPGTAPNRPSAGPYNAPPVRPGAGPVPGNPYATPAPGAAPHTPGANTPGTSRPPTSAPTPGTAPSANGPGTHTASAAPHTPGGTPPHHFGNTPHNTGTPPHDAGGPGGRVPGAEHGPTPGESRPDDGGPSHTDDHVPADLPQHLHDLYRLSDPTPGGMSLYGADDAPMRDLARRVPADPNRFIVDAHGGPDGIVVNGRRLSVDDVAALIRNHPDWNGREVMLLSCRTGEGDFAAQLAQRLGVPVTAPHGLAWSDNNGNVYASNGHPGPNGRLQPTIPPDGGWTSHRPDGATTPSGSQGYAPGHPRPDSGGTASRAGEAPEPGGAARPDDAAAARSAPRPPHQQADWTPPQNAAPGVRHLRPDQHIADQTGLDPNTRYRVMEPSPDGGPPVVRSIAYTDSHGNVTHVTNPHAEGEPGPLADPNRNIDLNQPRPDVVHQVDMGIGEPHVFRGGDDGLSPAAAPFDPPMHIPGTNPPEPLHQVRVDDFDLNRDGPFSLRDPEQLQPHTRYEVRDGDQLHGVFYTNDKGEIEWVRTWHGRDGVYNPELGTHHTQNAWDAERQQAAQDGRPPRDLRVPRPNTHYMVEPRDRFQQTASGDLDPNDAVRSGDLRSNEDVPAGTFLYHTDENGQTDAATGKPEYAGPKHARYTDVQTGVGHIGVGEYPGGRFDGGHIFGHQAHGPGERINYFPQWRTENQGHNNNGTTRPASWYGLEGELKKLHENPSNGITLGRFEFFAEPNLPGVTPQIVHARWVQTDAGAPPVSTVHYRSFHNLETSQRGTPPTVPGGPPSGGTPPAGGPPPPGGTPPAGSTPPPGGTPPSGGTPTPGAPTPGGTPPAGSGSPAAQPDPGQDPSTHRRTAAPSQPGTLGSLPDAGDTGAAHRSAEGEATGTGPGPETGTSQRPADGPVQPSEPNPGGTPPSATQPSASHPGATQPGATQPGGSHVPGSPSERPPSSGEHAPGRTEAAPGHPEATHGRTDSTPEPHRPGDLHEGRDAEHTRDADDGDPAHDPTHEHDDATTEVPEGLPAHLHDVFRDSESTPAGRSFYDPDDHGMRDLARRVPADPERFVLDGHGTPDGMRINGRHLDVDDVADLVRNDPNWNGREVMLLSCHTGDGDFAARLAQRLGVPVTAPTGLAWSDSNGNVYASSGQRGPDGRVRPTIPPDGAWNTHHPDGARTPAGQDGHAPGHRASDGEPRPDDAADRGFFKNLFGNHEPPPDVHAPVERPDFQDPKAFNPPDRYGTPLERPDGTRIPLFDGEPTREQTRQGKLGDCGIISTLGAIAGHMPEAIKNCVRENPDGTFEVRFHGAELSGKTGAYVPTGQQIVLTITPDLPVHDNDPGQASFADVRETGVAWTAILEKAIAGIDETWTPERAGKWEERWQVVGSGEPPHGYVRLNQGSHPSDRAELLTQITGLPAKSHELPDRYDHNGVHPDKQLVAEFRRLLDENKPILVGSQTRLLKEPPLTHDLESGHAYEVVKVDDAGRIHLRNPYGHADPLPLSAKEFRANMRRLYTTLE
ncbi:ADP-ribosyltransferase [Actinomadura fibrosa]|uniref:ADP-ribosyltransferase n=1 Tax=Actinomadura fibrosa TaxID=111802 RepID=UPI001040FFDE|nr:ADP-ribosyltransferase [Actinomadura fibrosa]